MAQRQPALFIPHGGGPWPFMQELGPPGMWGGLRGFLEGIEASLPAPPKAFLVVSAHWETERPTVDADAAPGMLFDYYGFPKHTYALSYPAPGAPELAARVRALLTDAGVASDEARGRGFDHGVFIPMMVIHPRADVPVLQMSLQKGASVARHLEIGRALAPLREEGVLIIGSGLSYHNLREFFSGDDAPRVAAKSFDDWLTQTLLLEDGDARDRRLGEWLDAPGGRASHPTPEHLEPLFVIAGAAGRDCARRVFHDALWGKAVSGFAFG